jgi:hypothetical protein
MSLTISPPLAGIVISERALAKRYICSLLDVSVESAERRNGTIR